MYESDNKQQGEEICSSAKSHYMLRPRGVWTFACAPSRWSNTSVISDGWYAFKGEHAPSRGLYEGLLALGVGLIIHRVAGYTEIVTESRLGTCMLKPRKRLGGPRIEA